uniref:Uncharacterized protein n=1 Tax=uncultured prokaryote TaxID=198431 RepID=A0A0H5QM10_9ZZZZ|nr:hypothetical protein [uncultured prokaryote]
MFEFNVEGVSVTDKNLVLHGVWDMLHTKRFGVIKVPLELVTSGAVLEHMQDFALRQAKHLDEEWGQFLLWG